MNSSVIRLYQVMSILLTMNKHHLFCFVHDEYNLIKLKLYINAALTIFWRVLCEIQTNQSNLLTFEN